MDHQLQVVIYAWLYEMCRVSGKDDDDRVPHNFKIFNIRTGEIQRLSADREHLDYIVLSLLQGKYERAEKITDEQFVRKCEGAINEGAILEKLS